MYKYFSDEELACKCGKCGKGAKDMSTTFMQRLIELRNECGFSLPISSAFRCREYNKSVSFTGSAGPHTTGHAVDIIIGGERAFELVRFAMLLNFTGIGLAQKNVERYIHLDDLSGKDYPRPRVWTY